MCDPKIIFGDEPTGALNSPTANEFVSLLAEIHCTVVTILDGKIAGKYLPGA